MSSTEDSVVLNVMVVVTGTEPFGVVFIMVVVSLAGAVSYAVIVSGSASSVMLLQREELLFLSML